MQSQLKRNNPNFRGVNQLSQSAAYLDSRVLMNKAILDLSIDVPMVAMANNSTERKLLLLLLIIFLQRFLLAVSDFTTTQ